MYSRGRGKDVDKSTRVKRDVGPKTFQRLEQKKGKREVPKFKPNMIIAVDFSVGNVSLLFRSYTKPIIGP